MRYILLFIAIFTFSCKYNISSPVGTIKDYSANSGKLFYTSSGDSDDNIETTLKKNKHSLGIYKIVVLGGDSTEILTNIKKVLRSVKSYAGDGFAAVTDVSLDVVAAPEAETNLSAH